MFHLSVLVRSDLTTILKMPDYEKMFLKLREVFMGAIIHANKQEVPHQDVSLHLTMGRGWDVLRYPVQVTITSSNPEWSGLQRKQEYRQQKFADYVAEALPQLGNQNLHVHFVLASASTT